MALDHTPTNNSRSDTGWSTVSNTFSRTASRGLATAAVAATVGFTSLLGAGIAQAVAVSGPTSAVSVAPVHVLVTQAPGSGPTGTSTRLPECSFEPTLRGCQGTPDQGHPTTRICIPPRAVYVPDYCKQQKQGHPQTPLHPLQPLQPIQPLQPLQPAQPGTVIIPVHMDPTFTG
jgi:hypothetical protein